MNTLDAMQVPFSDTFSWPVGMDTSGFYSSGGGNNGGYNGQTGGNAQLPSTMPSAQFPISLADIDEFFYENPP